jgi:PPP family 3-phenylpropionic acid transporter
MKTLPSFMFYLFSLGAYAFNLPYIVLYYQGLGFTGVQIGILAGMAPLITMVGAPLWTGLADAKGRHRLIMSLAILATVSLTFIFPFAKTLFTVILLVLFFSICVAPIPAFADSATMHMLGDKKEMYGRVRIGGTIGYGLASILAGIVIQSNGIRWAFWGFSILMLLAYIASRKFRYGASVENVSFKRDFIQVLTDRRWIYFLSLAFVGGVAFYLMNSYLFAYMGELGISRSMMGIAMTIATLGELPILFYANRLLRRFGAYNLFIFGVIISGVRLLLYAGFNFTAGILVFQLLNALTAPLVWVAGVSYADEYSPPGMKATTQGLLGAVVFGFGAAMGGLTGGLMIGSIGGQGMYLISGSLVIISVVAILLLQKAEHLRQARSAI